MGHYDFVLGHYRDALDGGRLPLELAFVVDNQPDVSRALPPQRNDPHGVTILRICGIGRKGLVEMDPSNCVLNETPRPLVTFLTKDKPRWLENL